MFYRLNRPTGGRTWAKNVLDWAQIGTLFVKHGRNHHQLIRQGNRILKSQRCYATVIVSIQWEARFIIDHHCWSVKSGSFMIHAHFGFSFSCFFPFFCSLSRSAEVIVSCWASSKANAWFKHNMEWWDTGFSILHLTTSHCSSTKLLLQNGIQIQSIGINHTAKRNGKTAIANNIDLTVVDAVKPFLLMLHP